MLATTSITSVITTSLLWCTLSKPPRKNWQPSNKQKGSNSEGHGHDLGGKAGSCQEIMRGAFRWEKVKAPIETAGILIHPGGTSINMHMKCYSRRLQITLNTLEKQLHFELQGQAALRDCQLQWVRSSLSQVLQACRMKYKAKDSMHSLFGQVVNIMPTWTWPKQSVAFQSWPIWENPIFPPDPNCVILDPLVLLPTLYCNLPNGFTVRENWPDLTKVRFSLDKEPTYFQNLNFDVWCSHAKQWVRTSQCAIAGSG